MSKLIISTLIVLTFTVGCSKEVKAETAASKNLSAIKAAVLADLKDPDSAKFGKSEMVGDNRACIEVNAKNSYGGYVGAKPFVVMKTDGKWEAFSSVDLSFDLCVKMVKEWKDRSGFFEK